MKKTCFLFVLAGCSLLMAPAGLHAEEQPAAAKPLAEQTLSAEDLKVIALMELLQKMEMLQDFQVLTAGEEKK
jgi:hypothetical protein